MSDDKFLDPKTNPMIKIRGDDRPPIVEEEDGPRFNAEDFRIPMGGYPEKKAAAASSSPDLAGLTDKQALEGLGTDALRELLGADEVLHIYDSPFYDPQVSAEKKLFMQPVISLEKNGADILVKRPDSGEHVLTAHEADLIRLAMKGKAE